MDELIVLFVNWLVKKMSGETPKRTPPSQPRRTAPMAGPAGNRRVAGTVPGRASVRRPTGKRPPALVQIAEPIITSTGKIDMPAQRPVPAPATATHAALPTVNARAIHRWLTPHTLRTQFILTEMLQPPLALRERR